MFKLLKLNNYWLNKAEIVVIILILTLNAQISQASTFWGYDDVVALIINDKSKIGQNLLMITGGDSFMSANAPSEQVKTMNVVLTGYSSTIDQTDDTPFITASGSRVRDGIVATNFLDFGTRVKIPAIFGDKVFTVEDRMAKKHSDKIDIWFPERHLAKKFGIQEAEVLVLQ